jgi:hypothetical protein
MGGTGLWLISVNLLSKLMAVRYGLRTAKMVKVLHFPLVFHYTCKNNNNVNIFNVPYLTCERTDNIFYIRCYYFSIGFNFDDTNGILSSQNYKEYKYYKNFKYII